MGKLICEECGKDEGYCWKNAAGTAAASSVDTHSGRNYYHGWFVDEVIEFFRLDFRLGNAAKYICRAGRKHDNKIDDLKKASTYIRRYQERVNKNRFSDMRPARIEMWEKAGAVFELDTLLSNALGIVCGTIALPLDVAVEQIEEEIKNEERNQHTGA